MIPFTYVISKCKKRNNWNKIIIVREWDRYSDHKKLLLQLAKSLYFFKYEDVLYHKSRFCLLIKFQYVIIRFQTLRSTQNILKPNWVNFIVYQLYTWGVRFANENIVLRILIYVVIIVVQNSVLIEVFMIIRETLFFFINLSEQCKPVLKSEGKT